MNDEIIDWLRTITVRALEPGWIEINARSGNPLRLTNEELTLFCDILDRVFLPQWSDAYEMLVKLISLVRAER